MLGTGAFTENFRSALNGFNRTDVVQFIQRQTVEHEKAVRLLREENVRLKQAAKATPNEGDSELRSELEALESKLQTKEQALLELDGQYRRLLAENEGLMDALATAKSEAETLKAELAAAKAAVPTAESRTTAPLDRPIAPPAGMATAPASFDEMELAAYRRAEQTERMARERASAASERIQSVFRQAESKMTLTAGDMNLLVDSLRDNCRQMETLMETARNILAESAESLKASSDLSSVI